MVNDEVRARAAGLHWPLLAEGHAGSLSLGGRRVRAALRGWGGAACRAPERRSIFYAVHIAGRVAVGAQAPAAPM